MSCLLCQDARVLNPSLMESRSTCSGHIKVCFWGWCEKSVFMHGFSSDRRRKLFRHVSKWSCFDSPELRGSSIPTTRHHVLHIYQQIRICHTQIFLKKPKWKLYHAKMSENASKSTEHKNSHSLLCLPRPERLISHTQSFSFLFVCFSYYIFFPSMMRLIFFLLGVYQ